MPVNTSYQANMPNMVSIAPAKDLHASFVIVSMLLC